MVVIRPAKVEDLNAVIPIYKALFAESAALQPGHWQEAEPDRKLLEETVTGDQGILLVAELDGETVGFAHVLEQATPDFPPIVPRRYAYMTDLAVQPGMRGKRIGTALIEQAKKWAADRQLDYIALNVLEENTRAAALYRRQGFRENMRAMRCPL